MADVELIIRKNRSTLVVGNVVLKDQDGNIIKPANVAPSTTARGLQRRSDEPMSL